MKTGLSTKCQDCQFWCKEEVEVSHRAIFTYNQAMKDFFSRYKFDGDFLLRKVVRFIFKWGVKKVQRVSICCNSPKSWKIAWQRINQVEGLVEAAAFKYLDLLEKREERASSSKSRSERLTTELPFFIKSGVSIPKKILLIDDIYTTGTTINRVKNCWKMLVLRM